MYWTCWGKHSFSELRTSPSNLHTWRTPLGLAPGRSSQGCWISRRSPDGNLPSLTRSSRTPASRRARLSSGGKKIPVCCRCPRRSHSAHRRGCPATPSTQRGRPEAPAPRRGRRAGWGCRGAVWGCRGTVWGCRGAGGPGWGCRGAGGPGWRCRGAGRPCGDTGGTGGPCGGAGGQQPGPEPQGGRRRRSGFGQRAVAVRPPPGTKRGRSAPRTRSAAGGREAGTEAGAEVSRGLWCAPQPPRRDAEPRGERRGMRLGWAGRGRSGEGQA